MPNYGRLQCKHISGPEVDCLARSQKNSTSSFKIKGIIDTGATITCLPSSAIDKLIENAYLEYTVMDVEDFSGAVHEMKIYRIHLNLEGWGEEVEVVSYAGKYAIIGRDILNDLKVILDGPGKVWMVDQKPSGANP